MIVMRFKILKKWEVKLTILLDPTKKDHVPQQTIHAFLFCGVSTLLFKYWLFCCISTLLFKYWLGCFQLTLQVAEHDTPENLLSNEVSAFSNMVQSTSSANAQYLRGLVLQNKRNRLQMEVKHLDSKKGQSASSYWAATANFTLPVSLNSNNVFEILNIED